jgi:hypothetical protein
MKKLFLAIALTAILVTTNANAFWGGNNNGWGGGDYNDWPVWTPMYWMEEMENEFDDNDWGNGGYGGGPYGYGAPYGGGYGAPYGGPGYYPYSTGYPAPVAPAAQ